MKEYGIACTDKYYWPVQWSYPSGWAPIQFIAYHAFNNYGKTEYAKEVAKKYMSLVEKVFALKGDLFEKYNVIEGSDNATDEGKVHHTMMGWTAGVYMYFDSKIR